MFPGGSPELVEPIYKNLKLSAPFNEQLTAIICDYVRHRLPSLGQGEKVRQAPYAPAGLRCCNAVFSNGAFAFVTVLCSYHKSCSTTLSVHALCCYTCLCQV